MGHCSAVTTASDTIHPVCKGRNQEDSAPPPPVALFRRFPAAFLLHVSRFRVCVCGRVHLAPGEERDRSAQAKRETRASPLGRYKKILFSPASQMCSLGVIVSHSRPAWHCCLPYTSRRTLSCNAFSLSQTFPSQRAAANTFSAVAAKCNDSRWRRSMFTKATWAWPASRERGSRRKSRYGR